MRAQAAIDPLPFEALKDALGAEHIGGLFQACFDETPQLLSKLQQAQDAAGRRTSDPENTP
jgi:hypothetical protein